MPEDDWVFTSEPISIPSMRWEVKSVWTGAARGVFPVEDGWEPFGVTSGRLWLRRRVEIAPRLKDGPYRKGDHVALVDNLRLEGGSHLLFGQRAVIDVDENDDGYVGIKWSDGEGNHVMAVEASKLCLRARADL